GRSRDQMIEVLQRAQPHMHGLVAAALGANCPRGADVARLGLARVVLALAMGSPDGVDGRQIEDVESEARNLREERLDVAKGSVPLWIARRGAGKQLVPGADFR